MDGRETPGVLCDAIRAAVGATRYATWFDGEVDVAVDGGSVELLAGSAFERDLLRQRFDRELRTAVAGVFGSEGRLRYAVRTGQSAPSAPAATERTPEPATAPAATPPTTRVQRSAAPASASGADPLADWVDGAATAEATRVCRRVLAGDPNASPVVLWGPAGSGKSHLLRTLSDASRARRKRTLLLRAEQFLVAFVEAIRGGGLPGFRQKHRGVELFLLDNVHQLIGKERTVEELQHSIDTLIADGGRVVLASDRRPADLAPLGPEIASRLAGGVAAELGQPDPAQRAGLLRHVAESRGRSLPGDVVTGLASRLVGGAREASGAINRLYLLHETYGLPLDGALAERVADDLNRVATPPVRIDDIQKAVCGVFGVEAAALRSKKRTKSCTEPRMLAMWLARKLTGSAWSEIGAHFGQRSHSTVISAHRRVETLLASGSPTPLSGSAGELREAIHRVEAALRRA